MLVKQLSKMVLPVALALGASSASAAIQSSFLIEGAKVQSVSGVWTYNERISVSEGGNYALSLTDFDFLDQFDFVGAMISTPTEKLAEYTIDDGYRANSPAIEFEIDGAGDYWISLFAVTNATSNGGTFGINLQSLDGVSEVPAPSALVLMLTSLLGLGSFARRWKNNRKA